jgi:lysozyme
MADRTKKIVGGGLAAAAATALIMAVGALKTDEGKRNVDYLDIAKVPTACYGHTGAGVKVGTRRSDAECETLLSADARTHMDGVIVCTPMLADRPYQLAAATRITFNIGISAYCRSTIARRFNAGDWRGGCDAFLSWNKAQVNGRTVVVRGLADRRARERAMCLTGL